MMTSSLIATESAVFFRRVILCTFTTWQEIGVSWIKWSVLNLESSESSSIGWLIQQIVISQKRHMSAIIAFFWIFAVWRRRYSILERWSVTNPVNLFRCRYVSRVSSCVFNGCFMDISLTILWYWCQTSSQRSSRFCNFHYLSFIRVLRQVFYRRNMSISNHIEYPKPMDQAACRIVGSFSF